MGAASLPASSIRPIVVGLGTVTAFFGCFGFWAALAPLDGSVIGSGSVTVQGNSKVLQHRDGGRVSAVLVREGDRVTCNQLLLKLDSAQARASLDVHQAALLSDRAMYARDMAELSNSERIEVPSELDLKDPLTQSITQREQAILANHRLLLREQTQVLDERLAQTRAQLNGAAAQHEAAMRALAYGVQQLEALTLLEHMGLAARNSVLELSRLIESLRGETGQLGSDVGRHSAEIAELRAEKLRVRAGAQSDAMRESREAQLRINDVLPRIAADHDVLNHLDIRAPVTGRVVDLQIFTDGGVIEPGKPILKIVPDIRKIVALAQIRPEDVEYLRSGQMAHVIATGFNPREVQPINGRILSISADRLAEPRSGNSYYTAEVSLEDDQQAGTLLRQLGPGMPVEVIIPVKSRTAMDYLLEPLTTSARSVGREM